MREVFHFYKCATLTGLLTYIVCDDLVTPGEGETGIPTLYNHVTLTGLVLHNVYALKSLVGLWVGMHLLQMCHPYRVGSTYRSRQNGFPKQIPASGEAGMPYGGIVC